MRARQRLLPGLALCVAAAASTAATLELTAEPAWRGWSRPGRTTEIDVRVRAVEPVRTGTLTLVSGRHSARVAIAPGPDRPVRLQLAIGAAPSVEVSVAGAGGDAVRLAVPVAMSESPLLAAALAGEAPPGIEGFHVVDVAAADLPRNAAAYSSIDALVIDAATLAALDTTRLEALLAHVGRCARTVVIGADERSRALLQRAAGCHGRLLAHADSAAAVGERLHALRSVPLPPTLPPGSIDDLNAAGRALWARVMLGLALAGAAVALAIAFVPSATVLLVAPAAAAAALLILPLAGAPAMRVVIWGEGESGTALARYQAWQQVHGTARRRERVALPPQLALAARPCRDTDAVEFDLDAAGGRPTAAVFDAHLLQPIALCFGGVFPVGRALRAQAVDDASTDVQNTGASAWPPGRLLRDGRVAGLPAVAPGARVVVTLQPASTAGDSTLRTALARVPAGGAAALWPLELTGVVDLPTQAGGWLSVQAESP